MVVRRCSKIPAKQPIRLYGASRLFAVVRVGWCTTGVNELRETPNLPNERGQAILTLDVLSEFARSSCTSVLMVQW